MSLGCTRRVPNANSSGRTASPHEGDATVATSNASVADAGSGERLATEAPQIDPDGNDDEAPPPTGHLPREGTFVKAGTAPLALTRICDLTVFNGALYAAHAHQPLGTDGATLSRFDPSNAKRPFTVAFDWNRFGEPAKGGGAGQGFLRIHDIRGRMFVPDADPPYNGLGLVEHGTEGYVFVSSPAGEFARSRPPHHRPPGPPTDARAGAGVLPRAYHVLDVIAFRGALYASTGSVPPSERAWRGPSPGALHRANDDLSRWTYAVDYPHPWDDRVTRLTFLVRFRDRLYAGIQDYEMRDPHDYVVFTPPPDRRDLVQADMHPIVATSSGGSQTLRWWVDTQVTPHRLYWLSWNRVGGNALRVTTDGDHWAAIPLPAEAGPPTDVTRFRDGVVVLAEGGLYALSGAAIEGVGGVPSKEAEAGLAAVKMRAIATVERGTQKRRKSPFQFDDVFCAAPLAVFEDRLYAGGQRGGSLYRLDER